MTRLHHLQSAVYISPTRRTPPHLAPPAPHTCHVLEHRRHHLRPSLPPERPQHVRQLQPLLRDADLVAQLLGHFLLTTPLCPHPARKLLHVGGIRCRCPLAPGPARIVRSRGWRCLLLLLLLLLQLGEGKLHGNCAGGQRVWQLCLRQGPECL